MRKKTTYHPSEQTDSKMERSQSFVVIETGGVKEHFFPHRSYQSGVREFRIKASECSGDEEKEQCVVVKNYTDTGGEFDMMLNNQRFLQAADIWVRDCQYPERREYRMIMPRYDYTVKEYLRKTKLASDQTQIFLKIAMEIKRYMDAGFVHRDIKAENIMLVFRRTGNKDDFCHYDIVIIDGDYAVNISEPVDYQDIIPTPSNRSYIAPFVTEYPGVLADQREDIFCFAKMLVKYLDADRASFFGLQEATYDDEDLRSLESLLDAAIEEGRHQTCQNTRLRTVDPFIYQLRLLWEKELKQENPEVSNEAIAATIKERLGEQEGRKGAKGGQQRNKDINETCLQKYSPNLVKYIKTVYPDEAIFFRDEPSEAYRMRMPFDVDMKSHLYEMTEPSQRIQLYLSIIIEIQRIHDAGFVHREIAGDNIMLRVDLSHNQPDQVFLVGAMCNQSRDDSSSEAPSNRRITAPFVFEERTRKADPREDGVSAALMMTRYAQTTRDDIYSSKWQGSNAWMSDELVALLNRYIEDGKHRQSQDPHVSTLQPLVEQLGKELRMMLEKENSSLSKEQIEDEVRKIMLGVVPSVRVEDSSDKTSGESESESLESINLNDGDTSSSESTKSGSNDSTKSGSSDPDNSTKLSLGIFSNTAEESQPQQPQQPQQPSHCSPIESMNELMRWLMMLSVLYYLLGGQDPFASSSTEAIGGPRP